MGKIHKHFWKWDDKIYDLSPYKLRESIVELKSRGLIIESEDGGYTGIDGFPWSINESEGKIFSVFFNKGAFFPICGDNTVWELEYDNFLEFINEITSPVDEDYEGDKLYIVFRDFHVAISGIITGKKENSKEENSQRLHMVVS